MIKILKRRYKEDSDEHFKSVIKAIMINAWTLYEGVWDKHFETVFYRKIWKEFKNYIIKKFVVHILNMHYKGDCDEFTKTALQRRLW